MSHTDPAILALRALGEPAGTPLDDDHVAQCDDCQSELERLGQMVGLARQDGPAVLEQPPAGLWEQIAAAVAEDTGAVEAPAAVPVPAAAPGDGAVAGARVSGQPPRRRRRLAVAVAALAAGLIIGIGGTAAVAHWTSAPATRVVAEIGLHPLAQFPQWQGASGTATLQSEGAAQELAVSLSAPQPSGFYEVWLLGRDGTSMISLGDLSADRTGTFDLPAGVNLGFYSRVDVSLQPFNGSTLHSRISVVRGSLPPTATAAGSGS